MAGRTAVIDAPTGRRPLADHWLWLAVALAVTAGIAVVFAVLVAPPEPRIGGGVVAAGTASDAERAELAGAIDAAAALAAETGVGQLADPTTRTTLLGAIADARLAGAGSSTDVAAARSALADAVDLFVRSRNAKALADAESGLDAVIGTGAQVLADSAELVADGGLLAALQSAIDAGRAMLADASATVDAVNAQAQSITDQTAAVLAARQLGFRQADGRWCAAGWGGQADCLALAWPALTLAGGETVELSGGESALGDSGCFETDAFGDGRDRAALLYCPAGEPIPDGRRASGSAQGDISVDRLWVSADGRLTQLYARAG